MCLICICKCSCQEGVPSTHSTNYAKRKHMANILQKDKLPFFIAVVHYLDRPNSKWSFQQLMAVKACVLQDTCPRTILLIPHLLNQSSAYLGTWKIIQHQRTLLLQYLSCLKQSLKAIEKKKRLKLWQKAIVRQCHFNPAIQQSERYLHFCGAVGIDRGLKGNGTPKHDKRIKVR